MCNIKYTINTKHKVFHVIYVYCTQIVSGLYDTCYNFFNGCNDFWRWFTNGYFKVSQTVNITVHNRIGEKCYEQTLCIFKITK